MYVHSHDPSLNDGPSSHVLAPPQVSFHNSKAEWVSDHTVCLPKESSSVADALAVLRGQLGPLVGEHQKLRCVYRDGSKGGKVD